MQNLAEERLARVRTQLARYEHPLLEFGARLEGGRVELTISLKPALAGAHVYVAELHPRDLDNTNFAWSFQQQLYACMHDYLVELFARTPQETTRG